MGKQSKLPVRVTRSDAGANAASKLRGTKPLKALHKGSVHLKKGRPSKASGAPHSGPKITEYFRQSKKSLPNNRQPSKTLRLGPAKLVAPSNAEASPQQQAANAPTSRKTKAAAAAAAAGPAVAHSSASKPQVLEAYKRSYKDSDGKVVHETFRAGHDLYVKLLTYEDYPEGDEPCEVCHLTDNPHKMLECSTCLRGFHMHCLKPKVKKIPEVRRGA